MSGDPISVVGKTNKELGLPRFEIDWPSTRKPQDERPPKVRWLRYGWRSVIGAIGRLFISLGMLLFGFVGYQLWGTGIQTAASQKKLAAAFESKIRAPLPRPATTTKPTTVPPTTLAPVPGSAATTTVAPTTTTIAPVEALDIPEADAAFAQLAIPRIGMKKATIVSGVTVDDLRTGVGHFRNTPLPGQKGNVALAGHRTTFGGPFGDLDQMQVGDPITFTNLFGEQYVYRVIGSSVVAPDDTTVLQDTPVPTLTLVTCTPKYTSTSRLIIRAVLDVSASTGPLRESTPPAAGKPEPLPPDTVETTTVVPATTSPGSPTTLAPAVTTTAKATVTTLDTASQEELTGALTLGWFSDKSAPPQVAIWGAICGVIGLGAWLISRRLHRNMIGFLIGIFPFLAALYFFYENANRLLPPGL